MAILSATPVVETNLPSLTGPYVAPAAPPDGPDPEALYFTINTTSGTGNAGSSDNLTYTHRFRDNQEIKCIFDWGDGTAEQAVNLTGETGVVKEVSHTYTTGGVYQIKVMKPASGSSRFNFFVNNLGDRRKIRSIDQWGSAIRYNNFFYAFMGCFNMEIKATDKPITSRVLSGSNCFRSCTKIVTGLAHWDFNQFNSLFHFIRSCSKFNEDLNGIVANNATTFNGFARDCVGYTFNLSQITAPKCTNYSRMLQNAPSMSFTIPLQWPLGVATNISSALRDLGNQPNLRLDLLVPTATLNNYTGLLTGTTMSTENYSNTLIAWNAIATLKTSETIGMGDATYNAAGATARASLITKWTWTIEDGGAA